MMISLLLVNLFPVLSNASPFDNLHSGSASALSKTRVSGIRNQQHTPYNLSDLSGMCPYADICSYQGREPPEKWLDSCCLPCSCNSTCGQIGNCCDKRENTGFMCHYPVVQYQQLSDLYARDMYFIIDKCLDGSNRDCTQMEAAPWGSLYPVYDLASQMSFYNPQCARCNGVEEFTEWGLTLDYNGRQIKNEQIRRALRGEATAECTINFTPPKAINYRLNICSDKLIDSCNVTGVWKDYNAEVEEACLRWNSPVLLKTGKLRYANAFCKLCNDFIGYFPEVSCVASQPDRTPSPKIHTFTIDYSRVAAFVDKNRDNKIESTDNGVCEKGMVKHISKSECRTVLCPNGFAKSEEGCRPLISRFLEDAYYVQLQLTPRSDTLLPRSYLTNLTDELKNNPVTWFDTKGAPLHGFSLYSRAVNINDTEYVKKLVVYIGKKKYPINLSREINDIKIAMTKAWEINLKGNIFLFDVKFYRFASFVPTGYDGKQGNVLNHLTLIDDQLSYQDIPPEDLLNVEMKKVINSQSTPLPLKKTHFCNRVRLARSEWIAGFNEIRLNISEEVLDSEKWLGDSEFDIFLDENGEATIEVCVEDFNPDYKEQQARRNTHASSGNGMDVTAAASLSITGLSIFVMTVVT